MLVSVCTRIDNHANYHLFFAIGTSLNQSKPIERLDNRLLTTIAITNTIIWNYNRDWSCEQAIIVPHDLRVDYITEQLYFYSMNSTGQLSKINQPLYWLRIQARSAIKQVLAFLWYSKRKVAWISIGHVNNIPKMQFFTGNSRYTQSKSYML